MRLARAAAAELGEGGVIGFVLSGSVHEPIPGLTISNGLRPGLAGFAKSLADELGPRGIRVVGLLPSRIDTDRVRELDGLSGDPEATRAANEARIPLRRYGTPEEFGRTAAFLLSPAASYLTGIMVPGGRRCPARVLTLPAPGRRASRAAGQPRSARCLTARSRTSAGRAASPAESRAWASASSVRRRSACPGAACGSSRRRTRARGAVRRPVRWTWARATPSRPRRLAGQHALQCPAAQQRALAVAGVDEHLGEAPRGADWASSHHSASSTRTARTAMTVGHHQPSSRHLVRSAVLSSTSCRPS